MQYATLKTCSNVAIIVYTCRTYYAAAYLTLREPEYDPLLGPKASRPFPSSFRFVTEEVILIQIRFINVNNLVW
jgi:hypothetical protein